MRRVEAGPKGRRFAFQVQPLCQGLARTCQVRCT